MSKVEDMVVFLENGGVVLSDPSVDESVSLQTAYDLELKKRREEKEEKVRIEVGSSNEKTRKKAEAENKVLEKDGKLILSLNDVSEDEMKKVVHTHYSENLELLQDIERFKTELNSQFTELPDDIKEDAIGFRGSDAKFHSYRVEANGNDLKELTQAKVFNVVVIGYVRDQTKKGSIKQVLMYHRESKKAWGFEQEYISPPAGRGHTLNQALSELNEETLGQLETNVSKLTIRAYLDKKKNRYYFIELEGITDKVKDDKAYLSNKLFESFQLKMDPSKGSKDIRKVLVPRRGNAVSYTERVFLHTVYRNTKKVKLGKEKYKVHVLLDKFVKKNDYPQTKDMVLLRFEGATDGLIYRVLHMLPEK